MFFLIAFLISVLTIILTWTPLAATKIGITNIFPQFLETAGKKFKDQGLSIFAFAFFLYAIFQSQAFQALFASKRIWLQKRKYFTIGLITICAAFLSSNLSWFDEFVHFYPLVIPLLLAMGFDFFSSVLCLYGGSIAGLLGVVSTERIKTHFDRSFGGIEGKINYSGLAGIGFRLASFALFVSIAILFNIWYCSRNQKELPSAKEDELIKQEIPLRFNKTRKIVLVVAGFFLLTSIFAQVPLIADGLKLDKIAEKVPECITSVKKEDKYYPLGRIEGMETARIEEESHKYWGTFGEWGEMAINCWLIVGGIIICLITKQNIMGNLTAAIQNSVPLLLVYIFAAVPADIISNSGMSKKLAEFLLPKTAKTSGAVFALFSVFGLAFLLTFIIGSTTALSTTLVSALAPVLLGFGESTLVYAALFAWIGAVLGMAFSPNNGILRVSLERGQTSYKQFIKKVWVLGLIMILAAIGLASFWAKFVIKN